ncbi:MAG: VWA domain-containing protein [Acidobacteriota bacterium]|nr:VWA domain-containing protein [Acidobacteriota bacterium]
MGTKPIRRAAVLSLICLVGLTWGVGPTAQEPFDFDDSAGIIELAIVLDTSGSMKTLIDAARLTMWDVVNELTQLDPPPQLRVALLTYGNSKNGRENGYVRIESPLTADLDLVSERLFQLETSGGEENVARVLQAAVEQLAWTDSVDSIKLVFIAGNESAEQDKLVDLRSVALDALGKDLVVHAVYCGREQKPDAESWKVLAEMASGQFASINHRTAALLAETPFDGEMAELSTALNQTYVPFGEAGKGRLKIQTAQDENAQSLNAATAATRAQTKAGALYSQTWDVVDVLQSGQIELYEIDEAELPEVMREMTYAERESYIEQQFRKRQEIRQQILLLSAQRRDHVAGQAKKKGIDGSRTFDGVVRRAIRKQLSEKGFRPESP